MNVTQVAIHQTPIARPKRRLFFGGMALVAIAIVMSGFVPEYVGKDRLGFPASWVPRVHATIMSAWMSLFCVQAYLGATRRISLHRKIGNFGIAIGWLAWASLLVAEWHGIYSKPLPEDLRMYDHLLPFIYIFITFPILLAWAYRTRNQPPWHKRIITCALFVSLEAAIERLLWLPSGFGYWPFAAFLDVCLLLPLVSFDMITNKRTVHPATLRGALVILTGQAVIFLLWGTNKWRHFGYALVHTLAPVLRTS